MAKSDSTDLLPPASARPPRQQRGQVRVGAILDATAQIIAEDGLEAVTMAAIRSRSGSTNGSLYHFFRDRDSVLRALADHHVAALMELASDNFSRTPSAWREFELEERVDRFLSPVVSYAASHPDFLPLVRGWPADEKQRYWELYEAGLAVAEALVWSCDPGGHAADRHERAVVIMAALDGMLQALERRAAPPDVILPQFKRMLSAYLRAI